MSDSEENASLAISTANFLPGLKKPPESLTEITPAKKLKNHSGSHYIKALPTTGKQPIAPKTKHYFSDHNKNQINQL
ncbi:MAG: hypothetical protein JNJ99_14565 [Crocinitomicaceae bacterium]|nr:hypothetical protein [Crocinitomicaceae bacterium]